MAPALEPSTGRRISRLLSALAVVSAAVAVTVLLLPSPLADVFFSGIVSLGVLFALVGAAGAWTDRTPLVWVAALLLTGLSILGMMSVGFLFAPAALCLLGAAVFAQLAGPRQDVRAAILADPPTARDVGRRTLLGAGSVGGGAGAVYLGAFERELFGSCTRETLACALETTNWGAVGLTVLGLGMVGYGGWLLWKQSYVTRVLAATQTR